MILDRISNDSLCHNQLLLMQILSLISLWNWNSFSSRTREILYFQARNLSAPSSFSSKLVWWDILTENLKWKYKIFRSYQVKMSDLDLKQQAHKEKDHPLLFLLENGWYWQIQFFMIGTISFGLQIWKLGTALTDFHWYLTKRHLIIMFCI